MDFADAIPPTSTELNEEEERLARRAAADMALAQRQRVALDIGVNELLSLISVAQVGLAHPQVEGTIPAQVAREVIEHAIAQLPFHSIRALARAGFRRRG